MHPQHSQADRGSTATISRRWHYVIRPADAWLRTSDRWAEWRLGKVVDPAVWRRRPQDACPPCFFDLWNLYRLVRQKRPRIVMEFGAGCSTVVLAEALAKNSQEGWPSYCYSLDESEYWADAAREMLSDRQRRFCEVWYSPVEPKSYTGMPGWRYTRKPAGVVPDLIYLDGPGLTPERQVAVDVLEMEPLLPVHCCVVVDARWVNAFWMRYHLKEHWSFSPSWLYGRSVLEKKQNPREVESALTSP